MSVTVIDDCSDWMSFDDALAHVEATQNCYQELAVRLLQKAADSLKIRSRTVQGSPRWNKSDDKYYSDNGIDLQFRREDDLKHWPEQQKEAAAPRRSTPGLASTGRPARGWRSVRCCRKAIMFGCRVRIPNAARSRSAIRC